MATSRPRPLSPHLTIWRWGPGMIVSILHRATGIALSVAGLAILTWWLMALATGPEAYAAFEKAAHHPIGIVILVGVTWSFFQHLLSGIRHLVMDTGAAFELGVNKNFAVLTIVGSVLLTVLLWAWLMGVRP
jgi:succinate dehydrogenase / fumarate reductase, cytochrome b subunit